MEVFGKYGLPLKVEFCQSCTRSNQRPHSAFEHKQSPKDKKLYVPLKDGICDACHFYRSKDKINWAERERELKDLCDKHRKKTGGFDVLVPGSGGKDSIIVAHKLKHKYQMNPVLCTWSPNLQTPQGERNFRAWLNLGFSNYTVYQNLKVHRLLTKLAFEGLCHPFQPFIIGQKNLAPRLAMQLGIDFIMFGEHDAEFGMGMDRVDIPTMDLNYYTSENVELDKMLIGGYSIFEIMDKYKLSKIDLEAYLPINKDEFINSKAEFHFYSYYERWNFHDNYYFAVENSDFLPSDQRLEGSYDKYASMDDKIDWLHFYTFYTKFGMGRATAAADQEIRSGVISRDEGIALVKRFDGEFPKHYLNDCLKYMDVSLETFEEVVENSRPEHLWEKKNGHWKLKHPIWKE